MKEGKIWMLRICLCELRSQSQYQNLSDGEDSLEDRMDRDYRLILSMNGFLCFVTFVGSWAMISSTVLNTSHELRMGVK